MTELTADFELAEVPEQRLSPLSALFGVLFRPRHTFTVMREARGLHWLIVPVMLIIVVIVYGVALLPGMTEATMLQLGIAAESGEELTPQEQQGIEQAQQMDPSQMGMFSTLTVVIPLAIGALINYLIRAGLLFMLGLALGGRASFGQVFRMSVWTTLPDVFRLLVSGIALFMTGDLPAPGLSHIFTGVEQPEVSPVLLAFLNNLDFYTLWSLLLVGIGVGVTYQIRPGKAVIITVIYWIIGLIFILGVAAALGSLTGATGG
jgi:hypothetical protein